MLRAIQMFAHVHRIPPLLTKQRRCQGLESFRRIQKNKYRDPETGFSRQNCQPRETFVAPKPDVKTSFRSKTEKKQDQRGILKSRDVSQVHNKRRVEVDCQNRDSLKEDVCSCLAR